ncbi:MAG TPA: MarR family transcriptional regulator [Bryobacteraceae bacterium]|jgi:DNA-binding MarR family transcriptional regulator|nr:MarR family transcriptional regulator [Bryobacteraceae bacterium]
MKVAADLEVSEYRALAEFRARLRRFLQFSERAAREAGIEPQQHQLLLAIKGLPEDARPTIRELAGRMLLKHHSTVELINRLERRGAVARTQSQDDAREVLIRLTRTGDAILRRLTLAHRQELETTGPELARALKAAIRKSRPSRKAA